MYIYCDFAGDFGTWSICTHEINCVCASVSEAEPAGVYQAAQTATHHRRILSNLGYPQPATMLRMDNAVALDIASGTMNAKRSNSVDMRFSG
jgi:hypothetical protein